MPLNTITYFIMPDVIRDRTVLHDNVEDKLIYPSIKAVQDFKIKPLLGSNLFRKMETIIADDTINTKPANSWYLELLSDYLADCICNYVMAEMPESLNFQMYNKGLSTLRDDKSTQPSIQDLYTMIATYTGRGDGYAKATRLYLLQNQSHFPEYNTTTNSISDIVPLRSTETTPLYLGDENEFLKDDYSLHNGDKLRNYNYNGQNNFNP